MQSIRNSFYEILINKKLNEEDVNFVEKEFNDIMLEEGLRKVLLSLSEI